MAKLPPRTLILMTVALFAFGWFWWRMHPAPLSITPPSLQFIPTDGGVP